MVSFELNQISFKDFSFKDYKIGRKEGILFLILFVTYYSYVLIS